MVQGHRAHCECWWPVLAGWLASAGGWWLICFPSAAPHPSALWPPVCRAAWVAARSLAEPACPIGSLTGTPPAWPWAVWLLLLLLPLAAACCSSL